MNRYRPPAILLGSLLSLIVIWSLLGRDRDDSGDIYVQAERGMFDVVVTTTGELRAKNSTKIMGPRNARDVRIYQLGIQNLIPEGTIVQKGDFVAELDRSEITTRLQDAQLQVQAAESQLEQAVLDSSLTLSTARFNLEALEFQLEERKLAVEQSIYESPSVQRQAQIELDRTRRQLEQEKENYVTRVKQAEARIRELETELIEEQRDLQRIQTLQNEFTVYAPENGMVIYSRGFNGQKVSVGSNVSSFDPVIAELPDFSVMESQTFVNEVDIQRVRTGQTVNIGLDAIPEKRLTGVVTSVANIGEQRPNSDSKVFEVVIVVNETDSTLRPSMTTSNRIEVETLQDVVYVPLESVFESDSTDVVFKQSTLGLVKQQVIVGTMNEDHIVIREGVEAGDRVLISLPRDVEEMPLTTLPEEVLERYRREEEERRRAEEERARIQRERAASQAPAGGMQGGMRFDFRSMTPEQRDSLRRVFQQRQGGGQGGGQPGGGQGMPAGVQFRMSAPQGGQGGQPGQRGQGGQPGQGGPQGQVRPSGQPGQGAPQGQGGQPGQSQQSRPAGQPGQGGQPS